MEQNLLRRAEFQINWELTTHFLPHIHLYILQKKIPRFCLCIKLNFPQVNNYLAEQNTERNLKHFSMAYLHN